MVLPALDLNILKDSIVLEAEVGHTLNLPVAMYGDHPNRKVPFTRCAQLPYKVVMAENQESFALLKDRGEPLNAGEGCTNVALKALLSFMD